MSQFLNPDSTTVRAPESAVNVDFDGLGESFELLHTSMPSFDESIFNSLTDAIVVVNTDMCIERVNPAALKLTGFGRSDLIGRPAAELTTNKRAS